MSLDRQKFQAWLRRVVYTENPATSLVLRHVASGKLSDNLLVVEVNPDGLGDEWEASTMSDIESHSEMDAGGGTGLQTYAVQAIRGERGIGRFRFRVESSDEDSETDSEPPTKAGLLGQVMRHNEAIMRSSVVVQAQTMSALTRAMEAMARENEKLNARVASMVEMQEDLIDRKHEREIEQNAAEVQSAIKIQAWEKLLGLAPHVIGKLAGVDLSGESSATKLLSSLSPDQQVKVLAILTDEQKALIGSNGGNGSIQ